MGVALTYESTICYSDLLVLYEIALQFYEVTLIWHVLAHGTTFRL